jgi:phage shock protein E
MSFLARMGFPKRPSQQDPDDASGDLPVELQPTAFLRDRVPHAPVLDVRTTEEFDQRHLEGAMNVDILDDRFMERLAGLELDRHAPVYLYCRTGNRSGHAARILRQNGYARAFNVGGLHDLVREGAATGS